MEGFKSVVELTVTLWYHTENSADYTSDAVHVDSLSVPIEYTWTA